MSFVTVGTPHIVRSTNSFRIALSCYKEGVEMNWGLHFTYEFYNRKFITSLRNKIWSHRKYKY